MRAIAARNLCLILFLFSLFGISHAADTLYTNQYLGLYGFIESPNQRYKLTLGPQSMRMTRSNGTSRWNVPVGGAAMLFMQNDGNLVMYTSNWTPLWSTGSGGRAANWFVLKIFDNGDLGIG
jgi:hypothetical protein